MIKNRTLILLGLSSFTLAVLVYLPAQLLVSRLPAGFPLQLTGVSGTLWDGAAQQAQFQTVQLHNLQWRFRPSGLLKAQLAADIQGQVVNLPGSIEVSGRAGIQPNRQYQADLSLQPSPQVNAQTRAMLGALSTVQADGSFRLNTTGQLK